MTGKPTIIGRSSSHFTRVTRIFAAELGVDCAFRVVGDLLSREPADYGDNPALKLPTLQTEQGVWFGALNICRELSRRSSSPRRIVWPEQLDEPLVSNAQELAVQAMASEVALILTTRGGASESNAYVVKLRQSLLDTLAWLELNATEALASLRPNRDLSYLEVTLFCLVTHLEFRDVVPVRPYPVLTEFCREFGARRCAEQTRYPFDA